MILVIATERIAYICVFPPTLGDKCLFFLPLFSHFVVCRCRSALSAALCVVFLLPHIIAQKIEHKSKKEEEEELHAIECITSIEKRMWRRHRCRHPTKLVYLSLYIVYIWDK